VSIIWQFQGSNRFLSNFYPAYVKYEGKVYPTAENAYQAAKTLDPVLRKLFLHIEPGEAKILGRKISLRPFWDNVKLQVMDQIVTLKFDGDEGLAKMLIDTYPQKLVEGNTWGDRYWGMVYSPKEMKWEGENHLGKILMRVRKSLL
jgi:ribA/ribD-fused uncharacterized protein